MVLVGTHLDDKYLDPQTLKKQLMEVRALYHPQVAPGASPPGMCILCVVMCVVSVHGELYMRIYICVNMANIMFLYLALLHYAWYCVCVKNVTVRMYVLVSVSNIQVAD